MHPMKKCQQLFYLAQWESCCPRAWDKHRIFPGIPDESLRSGSHERSLPTMRSDRSRFQTERNKCSSVDCNGPTATQPPPDSDGPELGISSSRQQCAPRVVSYTLHLLRPKSPVKAVPRRRGRVQPRGQWRNAVFEDAYKATVPDVYLRFCL